MGKRILTAVLAFCLTAGVFPTMRVNAETSDEVAISSLFTYWSEVEGSGIYSSYVDTKRKAGDVLYYIVELTPPDTDDQLECIVSDTDKVSNTFVSYGERTKGYLTITKPGTITVTFRSKLNPAVFKEHTFTVFCAGDHDWEDTLSYDDKSHWYGCRRCDERKDEAEHTGRTETVLNKRVCDVCGAEYDSFDKSSAVYHIFEDVAEEDWFTDYVQYVYDNRIMRGMDNTYFQPAGNLVRAQFAVILYRMEGSPKVEYTPEFPDVKEGEFYTDAVLWAYENEIVTGYADTKTFDPSDKITREQIAAMMHRYAKYKQQDVSASNDLTDFPDGELVNEFARPGMEWCVANGIITGNGSTRELKPQGDTIRAECAAIINRYMKLDK